MEVLNTIAINSIVDAIDVAIQLAEGCVDGRKCLTHIGRRARRAVDRICIR
ncbi:hypothetical protein [Paraburkholderia xenovorans]